MRILSRYVLREFLRFFLITLTAFMMVFLLGDFIEKVDDYIEHKAAVGDVAKYIAYQLPNVAYLVAPLAVLLSTLLAVGMLSKNSEVIAMKASGIPLYRIAAPVLWAAVILSGVLFWANETVIPFCNEKAEYIRNVRIEKKPQHPALKHDKLWFRGPKGEIINIGLVDFKSGVPVCYGVTFYRLDKDFNLVGRIDAARMDWEGGQWLLKKGVNYNFLPGGGIRTDKFASQPVDLSEKPDDFKRAEKLSEEMDLTELQGYIDRLKAEGYNPIKYVVDLDGKVSFTLASIIMVVVAVPFSLKTSRSGGMALGVGICIVLAIGYWLLYSFSMSFGRAGRFPPLFAAWFANLIYLAGGVYMLLQTDR